eukprot:9958281-Ditylum_brightwellii.AAC.1
MSLFMLHGNFKLQNTEWGKVHEQPAIPFVPKEEGSDAKNYVTKNCVAKFKLGNPGELINWRI